MTARTFTVGTHNTKHGAATFNAFADIIGWQEVDNRRATARLRNIMHTKGWGTIGRLGVEVPISFRDRDWHLHESDIERVHRGKPRVSPHRYLTWGRLEHKRWGDEIVFVNTHMVSGAFNANTHERAEAWRREMWNLHKARLTELLLEFRIAGHNVVLVGDLNRQHGLTFNGMTRADSGSVDHIWTNTKILEHNQLPRWGSDHPAERAKLQL